MAYSGLTSAQVAVDAPLNAELMQKIKDNFDYLYSKGTSENGVPNGDFEVDTDEDGIPDSWAMELYTAGAATFDTTTPYKGTQAYKFTRVSGAGNGGGYLESDYLPISEYISPLITFALKCSAAGLKVIVRLRYFNKDKVDLSSDEDIYSSTSNPTSWSLYSLFGIPPANARYIKIKLIGGYTDTDVAGSVYFDAIGYDPNPLVIPLSFTIGPNSSTVVKIPKGFSTMSAPLDVYGQVDGPDADGAGYSRVKIGSSYGTPIYVFTMNDVFIVNDYNSGISEISIAGISGNQTVEIISVPVNMTQTVIGTKNVSQALCTR